MLHVRAVVFSLVAIALLLAVGMPAPVAKAGVTDGLTVIVGPDPACAEMTTWPSHQDSCLIHVRTIAASSGFSVRLDVAWIGDGPTGVSKSFSNPVVACPSTTSSACGETHLRFLSSLSTWAPDTWDFVVTATRLCGADPCDPLDQASFTQSLVMKRGAVMSASCPSQPFYYTVMPCRTMVRDGDSAGTGIAPTSPPLVLWTTGEGCSLEPVETPDHAVACFTHVEVTPRTIDRFFDARWAGDAAHGDAGDSTEVSPRRRTSATGLVCPTSIRIGEDVHCTGRVFDLVAEDTRSGQDDFEYGPYGAFYAFSWAPGSGLVMPGTSGDAKVCTQLVQESPPVPSECEFSFTPTSRGAKNFSGYYVGSTLNDDSLDNHTVLVIGRGTTSSLDCGPSVVPVNVGTTCRAVVEDADGLAPPTGPVAFTSERDSPGSGSPGGLDGASCTLVEDPLLSDTAACSITFTPLAGALAPGDAVTIRASYAGDDEHEPSAALDALTVAKRGTQTSVTCDERVFIPLSGIVPIVSCAAVTADDAPGAALAVSGDVGWTSVPPESFEDAVDRGNCTLSALSPHSCNIGAALPIGTQMLTATYAGDANHTGSVGADLVHVHAETALRYEGPFSVLRNASFAPRVFLLSAAPLCYQDRAADFTGTTLRLDRDPVSGAAGAFTLAGPLGTDAAGALAINVSTAGWRAGLYTLDVAFAGDPYCDASATSARVLVGDPAESATGTGRLADQSTNFSYRVAKSKTGSYSGPFQVTNGTQWKLTGDLSSLVRASTGGILTCAADGTGTLSYGTTDAAGKLAWVSVGTVRFGTLFDDAGPNAKKPGDRWTVQVARVLQSGEPATLPGGPELTGLTFGNLICK